VATKTDIGEPNPASTHPSFEGISHRHQKQMNFPMKEKF